MESLEDPLQADCSMDYAAECMTAVIPAINLQVVSQFYPIVLTGETPEAQGQETNCVNRVPTPTPQTPANLRFAKTSDTPPRFGESLSQTEGELPSQPRPASRKRRQYETPDIPQPGGTQNDRILAAIAGMDKDLTLNYLGCLDAVLEVQAAKMTRHMAVLITPLVDKINDLETMLAKIAPRAHPASVPILTPMADYDETMSDLQHATALAELRCLARPAAAESLAASQHAVANLKGGQGQKQNKKGKGPGLKKTTEEKEKTLLKRPTDAGTPPSAMAPAPTPAVPLTTSKISPFPAAIKGPQADTVSADGSWTTVVRKAKEGGPLLAPAPNQTTVPKPLGAKQELPQRSRTLTLGRVAETPLPSLTEYGYLMARAVNNALHGAGAPGFCRLIKVAHNQHGTTTAITAPLASAAQRMLFRTPRLTAMRGIDPGIAEVDPNE
ncbi:hypothetical protein FN846DRAFT_910119 [Sphaerosporella brunnea]|uniref:Uncharacterized protein n=1 Tax=Sphaerosporella brunnea TaxID=1250544 RepID=A0A5J5EP07_9PEZI|nr:hypothetical protein FN846DRAFT_910119 [Sphaerosporella brunnea]